MKKRYLIPNLSQEKMAHVLSRVIDVVNASGCDDEGGEGDYEWSDALEAIYRELDEVLT